LPSVLPEPEFSGNSMKEEIAEKILEENKKIYQLIADKFSATRYRNWSEIKELVKYVKTGDRILDLGCGNGRLYKLLEDKNIDYTGIDSSQKLIDIARFQFSKAKFLLGDALSLPFKKQKFDVIFAIAFLHHIP